MTKIKETLNRFTTQYPESPRYQKDWQERTSDKLLILSDLVSGVVKEKVFQLGDYPYTPGSLKMSRFSYISWLVVDTALAVVAIPVGLFLRAISSSRPTGEESYGIDEALKQKVFAKSGPEVLTALIETKAKYQDFAAFPILKEWLLKQQQSLPPAFYDCADAVLTEEEEKQLRPFIDYVVEKTILLDALTKKIPLTERDIEWWIEKKDQHAAADWGPMMGHLMRITHERGASSVERTTVLAQLQRVYESASPLIQEAYKVPYKRCTNEVIELVLKDAQKHRNAFDAAQVIARLRLVKDLPFEEKELVGHYNNLLEWTVYNLFASDQQQSLTEPLSWIRDKKLRENLSRVVQGRAFEFLHQLDKSPAEIRRALLVQQFEDLIREKDPLSQACVQFLQGVDSELHQTLSRYLVIPPEDEVVLVDDYTGLNSHWMGNDLLERYGIVQAFILEIRGLNSDLDDQALEALHQRHFMSDPYAIQLGSWALREAWRSNPAQFTRPLSTERIATLDKLSIDPSLLLYFQFCALYEQYKEPDVLPAWRDLLFTDAEGHYFKALIAIRKGVEFLNRYPAIIESLMSDLKERKLSLQGLTIKEQPAVAYPLKEFVNTEKKFREDLKETDKWFRQGTHEKKDEILKHIAVLLGYFDKRPFIEGDLSQNLQQMVDYVEIYRELAALVAIYMPVYDELSKDPTKPLMLISCVWQRLPRYRLLLSEICKGLEQVKEKVPIYETYERDFFALNSGNLLLQWFLVKFNSQINRAL